MVYQTVIVCFYCKVCRERWWTHCLYGVPPRGVCQICWDKERRLTELTLKIKVSQGIIQKRSSRWWEVFTQGINPELYYHPNEPIPFIINIIRVQCRKTLTGVRYVSPEVKNKNRETYLRRQVSSV